ncbi:recombination protein RecR [Patescibacteria group bacterium]|nr:recombination protein RecR [Patescibacteria group bacterium]
MTKLPRAIRQLIEKFERLPGVGPKSAQRLVFYLLHNPEHELQDFATKLVALKKNVVLCSTCHNVAEEDPCDICSDTDRDDTVLCVVEQPLDLLALERSGKFTGKYHVLHGSIAPLNNIGPDQLYLRDILKRLDPVQEVILATNPTMEGEATALYIAELINQSLPEEKRPKISRIGHGLPIGADIEYADGVTLARALEGRRSI